MGLLVISKLIHKGVYCPTLPQPENSSFFRLKYVYIHFSTVLARYMPI
jgi:hypothetical protein